MARAKGLDGSPRIAWIESPLQFVNAVEYAFATEEPLRVIPRASTPQLSGVVESLRDSLPPQVTLAPEAGQASATLFVRSRAILIGDAHSGQVRATLAASFARDVVMVDDGSAMLAAMDQVARRRPMKRPGVDETALAKTLGSVASHRLHRAARRGRLQVFTAYSQSAPARSLASIGAAVSGNTYGWLRSLDAGHGIAGVKTIVAGSALVVDGLIAEEPYLEWVQVHAVPDAVYVAHRREQDAFLERVTSMTGLPVVHPDVPLEFLAAASASLERIATLPSSVLATLVHAVPPGVTVDVTPVADEWWMPGADAAMKHLLEAVMDGED